LIGKFASIVAIGSALAIAGSATGLAKAAQPTTGLVQVSGPPPSPLAGCVTPAGSSTARNYPDAEVEPQLAVDGKAMVAMWHQDRWSNGGAHGIGVGTSNDGGKTWTDSVLPADTCAPGTPPSLANYQRNSDPWVSFGPDGIGYASVLSFDRVDNKNAVAVARSTDGGFTWDNVQPIQGSVFTTFQNATDKNATTADPRRNKTAYTVWDTLTNPTDQPDDNPHTQAYTGPAYFSKTTDGGVTWSPATIIINTAQRQQTIGNIIIVDPRNGTLYDFTDLIISPNTPFQGTRSNEEMAFVKSTDGGDTWTAPQVIVPFNSLGVIDPNTGQRLRVGDGLEEVTIDPNTGTLYAVWESSTNYNKNLNQSAAAWDNEILLTSSSDGGATWTAPSIVHHLASGLPTYTPTVAINGATIAVTYYDNRHLAAGQTANLPADYWVSYSTDGGATFGNEQHIAGPFDQLTAPFASGFFLGDYEGLQPIGGGFEAVFVKTTCNALDPSGQTYPTGGPCAPANSTLHPSSNTNPTDVFAAALTP
jgi:Neuraminidase (sialidase)